MKIQKSKNSHLGAATIPYGWQGEYGGAVDKGAKVYTGTLDRAKHRVADNLELSLDAGVTPEVRQIIENDPRYQDYLKQNAAKAAKRKAWIIGGSIAAVVVIDVGTVVVLNQKK